MYSNSVSLQNNVVELVITSFVTSLCHICDLSALLTLPCAENVYISWSRSEIFSVWQALPSVSLSCQHQNVFFFTVWDVCKQKVTVLIATTWICLHTDWLSCSVPPAHTLNSWPQLVTDCAASLPGLPLSWERWVLWHLLHDTEVALSQVCCHQWVTHTHLQTHTKQWFKKYVITGNSYRAMIGQRQNHTYGSLHWLLCCSSELTFICKYCTCTRSGSFCLFWNGLYYFGHSVSCSIETAQWP